MNNTPLEYKEQCAFVEWLELKKLKFTAIPNSTRTKSWGQRIKNKKSGLRAGFPDTIVLVPKGMLCIEMKRKKGGTVTKCQKEWHKALQQTPGIEVRVCRGVDEAVEFVEKFI